MLTAGCQQPRSETAWCAVNHKLEPGDYRLSLDSVELACDPAANSTPKHRMNDAAQPSPITPLQGDAALVRALGPFQLGASIINIIVGAGIFMLPALLASRMGAAARLARLPASSPVR